MAAHDMTMIRSELPGDVDAIRAVTSAAFAATSYGSGSEAAIVDALRQSGALTVSLVAVDGGVVGHVGFSPVRIDGVRGSWYGLGPVSVQPERQRNGIGEQLIRDGLARLRQLGAEGCVVLGDSGYYRRFGFVSDPGLHYRGVSQKYFQRLVIGGAVPKGEVTYDAAFWVA
jgi:putative acetyltransferase